MLRRYFLATLLALLVIPPNLAGQPDINLDRYHTPEELEKMIRDIAESQPDITRIHELAVSSGGKPISLLEIGPESTVTQKQFPAVLVVANLEGTIPIASEAALFLINQIVAKPEVREDKTWFVLVSGNPDAAAHYFATPRREDARNNKPVNDDQDDAVDEDGTDDLNGDGFISAMRLAHPQGEWLPVPDEPRLLKKADSSKGEKGVYQLYTEGIDDDRDGEYNEDGPGGVNIGINFPHLFQAHTATGGLWAGSEEESFSLIKFVIEHREIAMTVVLGNTNFCLNPPKGGRQGSADLSKIEVPKEIGERLGIDTEKTYTVDEIKEIIQPRMPAGMELTESMIASFMGLGAVVNPLPKDLKFYEALAEEYKEFLKQNNLDGKRLEPAPAKDGSFELWSYYHLGLPSFSMDLWTLPKVEKKEEDEKEITPEKLEQMTSEEFIALGEERIDQFLEASGAPAQFKAEQVIAGLKGGMMTTQRMAEMLRKMPRPTNQGGADPKEEALLAFSDERLAGGGFLDWAPFEHPTLGQIEIGGIVPFSTNTPPAEMIPGLLEGQVPWVFALAGKMARMRIARTEVEALGADLHRIKVWVENTGYLPYPTAMGKRNTRITPVIVTLEGAEHQIIEGKKRHLIQAIDGNSAQMVSWIIRTDAVDQIIARAATRIAWQDEKPVHTQAEGGAR
jgi:hypothetical protein